MGRVGAAVARGAGAGLGRGGPAAGYTLGVFTGRPLPACRSYVITDAEAGYGFTFDSRRNGGNSSGIAAGVDVGWMRNVNERDAIGGALGVSHGAGSDDVTVTLGPRYRRWLSRATSVDVGLSAAWEPGRIEIIELHTGAMYRDRVGLWVNASQDLGQGVTGIAAGIKAGSEPALGAYGLAVLSVVAILATWESD